LVPGERAPLAQLTKSASQTAGGVFREGRHLILRSADVFSKLRELHI
jgi:hypothetical protein